MYKVEVGRLEALETEAEGVRMKKGMVAASEW